MTIREFPRENSVTRRTGVDIVLQFVHQYIEPAISQDLNLQIDVELTYEARKFTGETQLVYGVPYCSLWYGNMDDMAINFVVVYSKRPASSGETNVLAYMGKFCVLIGSVMLTNL